MTVAYGSCVGSWQKLYRNVVPRVGDSPLFALSGQTSLCRAYNTILDAYRGRDLDAVILLHDDLEIVDRDAEAKFLKALADSDVAIAGVCGGKGDKTLAWWESKTVGHQMTDSGMLDFGERTGDVAFVEGSIMVFSPWAVEYLRFDERYPGFLGYDDVCLTARAAGKTVVVADVDTHHHSTIGFKSSAIKAAWDVAEGIFQDKWHPGVSHV
jgi:Glycosyltransferase like family